MPPAVVLSLEFVASLASLLLNSLLYLALRRYSVFHDNLRVICRHLTLCVLVASLASLVRALVIGLELVDPERAQSCLSTSSPLPFAISVLFTVFTLFALIERLVATHQYEHYEQETAERPLRLFCVLLWIPMLIYGAVLTGQYVAYGIDAFCPLPAARFFLQNADTKWRLLHSETSAWQAALRRNLAHVVVLLFQGVFCFVFVELVKQNVERMEIFVRHQYRSLSTRFQIGENIKTSRLLAPMAGSMAGLCVALFLVDMNAFASDSHNLEWGYLLPPVFGAIYALNFLHRDSVLRRKALPMTRELVCRPSKEHKLLESA